MFSELREANEINRQESELGVWFNTLDLKAENKEIIRR